MTKGKLKGKDDELRKYYDLGLSDSKIAEKMDVCTESVRNWRLKNKLNAIARIPAGLGNLKFSNINKEKFLELYEKKYNDPKIGEILNESPYTIFRFRTTLGLPPVERFDNIILTEFQKQVFLGHLLGDGNLHIGNDCKNASGKIEQCIKQKDYFLWKFEQLNILTNNKITYSSRDVFLDNRLIKTDSIQCYLPAHPLLTEYYYKAYKDNVKTLTKDILRDFNDVALAVIFMDDGCKYNNGYSICTNGFDLESIIEFKNMLFYRFNLHSIHSKKHQIHILSEKDARKFEKIVSPYVIPSMEYKLHQNPFKTR